MYNGLLHAHSGLRWVALALILVTLFKAYTGKNTPFSEGERKLGLFTLISFHTQMLLGLGLYFISPKVSYTAGFMKDSMLRFFAVEHIFGMLLAIAFVTIGYSKSKKKTEAAAKRKTIRVWFTIALIIILLTIPWPFRMPGSGWV